MIGPVKAKLYEPFCRALEKGGGVGTPYFHIGAVKAARASRSVLPVIWLESAYHRLQVILKHGGVEDEQALLALALAKWLESWGDMDNASKIRRLAGGGRLRLEMKWPGRDWIPEPPPPQEEEWEY